MTSKNFRTMMAQFNKYHKQFVACSRDGTLTKDFFGVKDKCEANLDLCCSRNCPKMESEKGEPISEKETK